MEEEISKMKKRKKLSRKGLAFLLAVVVSFSLFSMDFFPARALMSDDGGEEDYRAGMADDFDGDASTREYIVYFEDDIGKGRIPFRDSLGSDLLGRVGITEYDGDWNSTNADVLRFDSSGRAVVYGLSLIHI